MFPFIMAGLSMLQGAAARGAAKAENIIKDGEAAAANIVREGQNIENAAKASFGGFMASLNNNRALDAAGRARASAGQNLQRLGDSITRGSIEDQIANAEGAGAYAASVAMAGGGGSSVDAISRAQQLKAQRGEFYTKERGKQMTHDQLAQMAGIIPQTVAGLDIGTYSAAIDYSTTLSKARPVQGNALLDFAKGYMGGGGDVQQAAQSVSNFFTPAPSSRSMYSLSSGGNGQGLKMGNTPSFFN